jgi:hypothetical protein
VVSPMFYRSAVHDFPNEMKQFVDRPPMSMRTILVYLAEFDTSGELL